jgi:2-C-methyl-D-erythritol 4-phosphate cytidylyltransferase/2-C-methyl-D-erythritol 2,4-cyclodiphosphate synthase
MQYAAIIVAAGRGTRPGANQPKQVQSLLGRPVLAWSTSTFTSHRQIAETIIVTTQDVIDKFSDAPWADRVTFVLGGATRTASVKCGLAAISLSADCGVLIHDAARPGIDAAVIDALIEALDTHRAAAPALPVADALKRPLNGQLETVDRSELVRVQTPQAFQLRALREAFANADEDLVDDLAALEPMGIEVAQVAGSVRYGKITYPEDFETMARLLSSGATPRIGKGFDVHAFEPGDHVTLCGVKIAHSAGLKGHSDADAAWHALTDAILGAAALGDIGDHFPPSDERWSNADSAQFLKHASDLALQQGLQIGNVDITIICEAPKIGPHRQAMRERTAELLNLSLDHVSVKATTTETLGFTGRGDGLAAEAVALLIG